MIIGHAAVAGRLLLRQQQPAHLSAAALQHTNQSTAQMAVRPGNNIQIFHAKISFLEAECCAALRSDSQPEHPRYIL